MHVCGTIYHGIHATNFLYGREYPGSFKVFCKFTAFFSQGYQARTPIVASSSCGSVKISHNNIRSCVYGFVLAVMTTVSQKQVVSEEENIGVAQICRF